MQRSLAAFCLTALVSFAGAAGCGGDPVVAIPDLASVDKTASCASSFGQALTNSFGRADGTVLAVIQPGYQQCAQPNMTHLVVQVSMNGAAYRMVVDVLSNQGSPDVWFAEVDAPLQGGPWSEGWHPGQTFDYATNLGVHSTAFAPMKQADLVTKISSQIEIGARISIFATSEDRPDSAHLVHHWKPSHDGSIVVHPDSPSAHWLLMRFDEDVF